MTTPRIELRHVGKTFVGNGRSVPALRDVSLKVMPGEFVTIIGASGSGKSTLFNLLVGLLEPDEGSILINGEISRNRLGTLGYMPQRDLLLPWRSVLDNVLLSQDIKGVPRKESRPAALEMFRPFGLEGFEHDYPSSLSGVCANAQLCLERGSLAARPCCSTNHSGLLMPSPAESFKTGC